MVPWKRTIGRADYNCMNNFTEAVTASSFGMTNSFTYHNSHQPKLNIDKSHELFAGINI